MKKLKQSVITEIRNNKELKAKLQLFLNISASTLDRWLNLNSSSFTQLSCLYLIAENLGYENHLDLLEKEA